MDYRAILRQELQSRVSANARYSLRAFARDLQLDPSFLSAVLNGRKGLSLTVAKKITRTMKLGPDETQSFCDAVQALHGRSRALREVAAARLTSKEPEIRRRNLSLELFRVTSDWYHWAIREMVHLPHFQPRPEWFASRLGISKQEAAQAWWRLTELGLVTQEADGTWKTQEVVINPHHSEEPVRRLFAQLHERSREACAEVEFEARSHTAYIFPMNLSQMETARNMIRDFRRSFKDELNRQSEAPPERVYCIAFQLFPLDKAPEGASTPSEADRSLDTA